MHDPNFADPTIRLDHSTHCPPPPGFNTDASAVRPELAQPEDEPKPNDCNCTYPAAPADTLSGHAETCPAHLRLTADPLNPKAALPPEAAPEPEPIVRLDEVADLLTAKPGEYIYAVCTYRDQRGYTIEHRMAAVGTIPPQGGVFVAIMATRRYRSIAGGGMDAEVRIPQLPIDAVNIVDAFRKYDATLDAVWPRVREQNERNIAQQMANQRNISAAGQIMDGLHGRGPHRRR